MMKRAGQIGLRARIHELLRPSVTRAYHQMVQMESWTIAEIEALQLAKLNRLLRQFAQFDFYRDLLARVNAPAQLITLSDLSRLPGINKQVISDNLDVLGRQSSAARLDSTSGSTGRNFRFWHSADMLTARSAAVRHCYSWVGIRYWQDPKIHIWGLSPQTSRFRALAHTLKLKLLNAMLLQAFGMDEKTALRYLQIVKQRRPVLVDGYPSYLHHLARTGMRHHIEPPVVRCLISSGETIFPEQREEIEEYFDAPVYNRYGSREFGVVAHQCEHQGWLHIPPSRFVVENDAEGSLLITDLDNDATPFIRYAIGDAGIITRELCLCGRPLASIKEITGRSHDVIRTASGRLLPGQFWTTLSRKVDGIEEFQVVQHVIDRIEWRIKTQATYRPENDLVLKHKFDELVGEECQLEIMHVEHIDPTPVGKRRFIISMIED